MDVGKNNQVKIQNYDASWQIIQSYPLQTGVKLEVDQDLYPRVKWYPIKNQQKPQKMIQQKQQGKVGCLRKILVQILSQEQKQRLQRFQLTTICDYRHYLYPMLSIVKSKPNVMKLHLLSRLKQEVFDILSTQKYSASEVQQINNVKLSCIEFIEGRIQNAVRLLQKGHQESKILKFIEQAKNMEQNPQASLVQPKLLLDAKMKQQNQDSKIPFEENPKMNKISSINYDDDENPFLIYDIENHDKKIIYSYDHSLKPKRRILDYLIKS